MAWFLTLIAWIGVAVFSELIRPKPKFEDARPAGEGDFSFPTATEGRSVPLVWGRVRLRSPNLIWYGNIRNQAITEEVRTGWFSSDTVTTGYRYFVSMQFGLCLGPVDKLERIWVEETISGGGAVGGSEAVPVFRSLGGDDVGGNGAIDSDYGMFYAGNFSDNADPFLDNYITLADLPAYRGTAYYMFDGTIGNSPNLGKWAFEVSRRPDGLNMASADPGAETINLVDCNPMNALYEIMTDTDWGLGISSSDIDIPNFQAAASTLKDEGNGFSMLVDSGIEASELVTEIQRQIDGALYFDRNAGQWKTKLVRDDYTPASLDLFDESNSKLIEYARSSWAETTNQVRVAFTDFQDNWKDTYAVAQDTANFELQGGLNVSSEVRYPGVKNRSLANNIAWRELRVLSYPLARITIEVNRAGFALSTGSVFRWSNVRLAITDLVFRVNRINFGRISKGMIEIEAVEDIFSTGSGAFGDPTGSGWGEPLLPAEAVVSADTLVFEVPRQVVIQEPFSALNKLRVFAGARTPGGGTVGFKMYSRFGPSRPLTGDPFYLETSITRFMFRTTLDSNLPAYGSGAARPATDYVVALANSDPDDITPLEIIGSSSSVSSLNLIAYIDGEFIGYEIVEDQGGGIVHLKNLYRGLFNTAPKAHSAGTDIWFIGQGGGNISQRTLADSDDEMDIQLRSLDAVGGEITEVSTPVEELTIVRLWRDPLPPRDPVLNDVYAPSSEDVDTQYTSETGLSGDDARALKVEFTPRAWRVNDPIDDHILTASTPVTYLSDDPNFEVTLILDPSGTPVNVETLAITGSSAETPEGYFLRDKIIEALGVDTNIPSTGRIQVVSKHTPVEGSTEYTANNNMLFDFSVTSSLQGSGIVHGALTVSVISTGVTYNETGTYSFDIKTALPSSGILEGRINGGSFTTIISAGTSTGNLPGVTSGDTIELRFTQAPNEDQFFEVSGPTSETGYGVLLA